MEKFETTTPQNPEANTQDVQNLRSHLEEQGFTNIDDHDAVLETAGNYFSNYANADVIAIVSALYHEEQAAALDADNQEK